MIEPTAGAQQAVEMWGKIQHIALPWQSERGYHVEKRRTVATFHRKSVTGRVLATVTSITNFDSYETSYEFSTSERPKAAKTLADAFAEADGELQVAGYKPIGRVVWT